MSKFLQYSQLGQVQLRKINIYIYSKGFATLASLFLSVIYSKSLGLERRSVLAYIMAVSLLTTLMLNSGISYYYRKYQSSSNDLFATFKYSFVGLINSAFTSFLVLALLLLYGKIQSPISINLIIVSIAYNFASSLNCYFVDILIANHKIKHLSLSEIAVVIVQLLLYFFLVKVADYSVIVRVLISIILSYAINISLIFIANKSLFKIKSLRLQQILSIYNSGKKYYWLGIAVSIMDRIDRFLIGLYAPNYRLAQYSVMAGLITSNRFLPEAITRLRISHNQEVGLFIKLRRIGNFWNSIILLAFLLVSSQVTFYLVKLLFGSQWALPKLMIAFFVGQEIIRSFFIYEATDGLLIKNYGRVKKATLTIILFGTAFIILGIKVLGLYGVSIAIMLTYGIGLKILADKKDWKNYANK